MGRRIPIGDDINNDFYLIHFSVFFHLAWMAATLASISALCIRRKSKHPKESPPYSSHNLQVSAQISNGFDKSSSSPPPEITMLVEESKMEKTSYPVESDQQNEKLPLPPAPPPPPEMNKKKKKTLRETSSSNNLTRALSMQRIGKNLSMKISRSMSMSIRQQNDNKKKGKLKADQDSIWSKAIILGEKCRPDDEDDTVIYDNKGNRISPYHKKTHSHQLSSLSRTISQFDSQTIAGSGLLDSQDKANVRKDEGVPLV